MASVLAKPFRLLLWQEVLLVLLPCSTCTQILALMAAATCFAAGLGSGGGFERLHFLLEKAWDGNQISLSFMKVKLAPTCYGGSIRATTDSVASVRPK